MASTPARTVRTVRLTIAFVVTLAVVLMTLRIENSSSACAQEAEGMKQFRDPKAAVPSNLLVIGDFEPGSPVLELEYYLGKGGRATLVQPARRAFVRSCQQEGNRNGKVRAKSEIFDGRQQFRV